MDKQKWIDIAEVIDALRVFPRLFFGSYIVLFMYSAMWAMSLTVLTMAQAGLVATIIGAGAAWFGLYNSTGRRYN